LSRSLRLLLHALGFLLRGFRLSALLLSLKTGGFGLLAPLGFSVCISTGSRCARVSLFIGDLLHRHHARFFGVLYCFARRPCDGALALFAPIIFFCLAQLLLGLAQ